MAKPLTQKQQKKQQKKHKQMLAKLRAQGVTVITNPYEKDKPTLQMLARKHVNTLLQQSAPVPQTVDGLIGGLLGNNQQTLSH